MKKVILFGILLITLICGFAYLFQLRLEKGDQYPAYSTFRSDPKGARILFETLEEWNGGGVNPILNRTWEKPSGKESTWILLDAQSVRTLFDRRDSIGIKKFLEEGGRLVIAFSAHELSYDFKSHEPPPTLAPSDTPPENSESNSDDLESSAAQSATEEIQKQAQEKQLEKEKIEQDRARYFDKNYWNIEKDFGFKIAQFSKKDFSTDNSSDEKPLSIFANNPHIEPSESNLIPWRSLQYFLLSDSSWKILYEVQSRPVVIEKAWGNGSIVLMTDPSLMSNQSLSSMTVWQPLLPLLGIHRHYWFDETHLKVVRRFSLMQLMQKSGGTGLWIGLVILFLLWIWKNQSTLAPLAESRRESQKWIQTPLQNLKQLFQLHFRGNQIWNEIIQEKIRHSSPPLSNEIIKETENHLQKLLLQKPRPSDSFIYQELSEILNQKASDKSPFLPQQERKFT